MDTLDRFVADAVLGIDTLWGGDVMCPSGTGRFIADSWFSDEPLPAAYTVPAAARVRESGGAASKKVDRAAVEEYLREVDIPQAIAGVRDEARDTRVGRGVSICSGWHLVWKRCGTLPWKCSGKASPFHTLGALRLRRAGHRKPPTR